MYKTIEKEDGVAKLNLYEGYANTKYQKKANYQEFPEPSNSFITTRDVRYLNIIYTDGEVNVIQKIKVNNINDIQDSLSEEENEKIKQIYKENWHIDEVDIKKLILKNASYYILIELSQVLTLIGNVHGWFWSIENMQVHIDEPTTSKTLKNVRNTIKLINKQKLEKNTNIFDMLIIKNILSHIEYQKAAKNVYQLKK